MGVRESDLDDMIQDVFLVAHRKGGYMPGAASPTTYLANIAIRVRAVHIRKRKSRTWPELNPDAVRGAVCADLNPLEMMVQRTDEACFHEALTALDDDKRAIFLLVEVEGENCCDVAAGLDIPLNTAYSRLRAARRCFSRAARVAVGKKEWWRNVPSMSNVGQAVLSQSAA